MKRTALAVSLSVVAIVGMGGCSAPAAEVAPTPTVTSTPSAEPAGTTLDELQSMYIEAGGECDSISPRQISVAEEAGDCDDGTLLTTYSSESQRDGAIVVLQGLQDSNPSPLVIVVGPDWIVNGGDADMIAAPMGGEPMQIGEPAVDPGFDLTTDAGLCAADAEMTSLELNDALAPLLGFPADRDARSFEQDEAIRDYKNAAFERECPARAG